MTSAVPTEVWNAGLVGLPTNDTPPFAASARRPGQVRAAAPSVNLTEFADVETKA
jgi:hypothetical protein